MKAMIIWGILLFLLVIFSFGFLELESIMKGDPLGFFLRFLSLFTFLLWSNFMSEMLRDVVNIKYKITTNSDIVAVKYLTVLWLFIPYWKPIKTNILKYKAQNIFGAKSDYCYEYEKYYQNEDKAKKQIKNHKEEFQLNRKILFQKQKTIKKYV